MNSSQPEVSVKRNEGTNNIVHGPKRTIYWLLVRDGHNGIEVLTTGLPDGRQALPVFSFEEEAEMFLYLRGLRDGWRI